MSEEKKKTPAATPKTSAKTAPEATSPTKTSAAKKATKAASAVAAKSSAKTTSQAESVAEEKAAVKVPASKKTTKAPAAKASAAKSAEEAAPAKKASAEKAVAAKATEETAPAKTAPAKKAVAAKATEETAPAKKAPAKKTTAKKTAAEKAEAALAPAKDEEQPVETAPTAPVQEEPVEPSTLPAGEGAENPEHPSPSEPSPASADDAVAPAAHAFPPALQKNFDRASLSKLLKSYFGFDTFKGDQEAIILNVLSGNDTFVLMPTGGGKSLCYQLPSLLMDGVAIVISPLIALMKNQVDAIRNYSEEDGVAHFINSSLNKTAIDQVKEDIVSGKTKLLYVAPESLTKEENVEFLRTVRISFYAIDEAHCISEWGHDFRPEYRKIRPIIDQIGRAPIIALTATATNKVRDDIKKNLGILDAQDFKSSFNRPNLYYEVRSKTKNVDRDIIRFIKMNAGKSGIIYCLSRKKVEELAEILRANDIPAAAYHAGMESTVRTQTQDDFLMEKIDVIVATIAFGMGIDKPDVRYVIHYDIPKSLEGYYQETGRAGRDGGEGQCIAFYSSKDLQKLEKFLEGKPIAEQDIGRQLLQETTAYCESSVCRRKMLLHYFGEDYPEENCGNCDNCLNPKKRVEAQDELCSRGCAGCEGELQGRPHRQHPYRQGDRRGSRPWSRRARGLRRRLGRRREDVARRHPPGPHRRLSRERR